MHKLLITVEQVFTVRDRGFIVIPEILIDQLPEMPPKLVMLKRPDGTTINAKASFHVPHTQTKDIELTVKQLENPRYICILEDIDQSEIPIGTELWIGSYTNLG
jgi:hypothetical protein